MPVYAILVFEDGFVVMAVLTAIMAVAVWAAMMR
jgi:hypothetical protein